MTAATLIATPDDNPHNRFTEMLARQTAFDATRPACPPYCDGTCNGIGHNGDAVIHSADPVQLPCDPASIGVTDAHVRLLLTRFDSLGDPSEERIAVDVDKADGPMHNEALLTPQQAYALGAALIAQARRTEAELTVPAPDVKIGDWLQVGTEWLQVYCVLIDEPADSVQISVTADPAGWPDFADRDENPEDFTLADTATIRRHGPRSGGMR